MATPYIDRAGIEALLGVDAVAKAESDAGLNVAEVIEAQCAVADGYVAAQVALPPSAQAQAQVAPLVAELVYAALWAYSGAPNAETRRDAALRQLRDIASSPPKLLLHVEPMVDDPATEDDESGTGSASSAEPRKTGSRGLRSWREMLESNW